MFQNFPGIVFYPARLGKICEFLLLQCPWFRLSHLPKLRELVVPWSSAMIYFILRVVLYLKYFWALLRQWLCPARHARYSFCDHPNWKLAWILKVPAPADFLTGWHGKITSGSAHEKSERTDYHFMINPCRVRLLPVQGRPCLPPASIIDPGWDLYCGRNWQPNTKKNDSSP